ncbi:MAG: type II toxin-antitoxin system HicA family toxin [Microcystis sp. LE19-338.1B]|nr:type II toxin-antitoxin system HicA family toxin [Microcystis sp. LE19-338.1B]MCZ8359217.1 type II toxin-antitoxin system HicA family toxin [Microcystis sp. LE19-388.1G]
MEKVGFYQKRGESSPVILRRDNLFSQVVVPDHPKLAKGIWRSIIRDAELRCRKRVSLGNPFSRFHNIKSSY